MVDLFGQPLSLVLAIAGAALVVAEALAPGAHFIVIGVALLVAGLVGLTVGGVVGSALLPLVLAAAVLATGGAALYVYREFDFYGGKGIARTRDSSSLKGKTGRVTERVTPTSGEVKVNGGGFNPHFSARTLDGEIPDDTEVIVVDPGGGNVLTVESLTLVEDEIDRELARGRDSPGSRERPNAVEHDREPETDSN